MSTVDKTMTKRQHRWLSLLDIAAFNLMGVVLLHEIVGWADALRLVVAAHVVIRAAITAERLWRVEPGAGR